MKVFLASALLVIVFISGVAGSYLLSIYSLNNSQHQWCQTLTLLTQKPVPAPADPKSNPSREDAYLFYVHLQTLEKDFHC